MGHRLFTTALVVALSLAHCSAQEIRARDAGHWDGRFATPGVQGYVATMAFDHKRIFIGGGMQSVGRVKVNAMAEFNSRRFRALPDGPQQEPPFFNIISAAYFQKRLYVGGFFTNVSGHASGGLASWNGRRWSVTDVTNGFVYALKTGPEGLLVAGYFTLEGHDSPATLARFDGREWQVLAEPEICCGGTTQQIEALSNGDIVFDPSGLRIIQHDGDGNATPLPGPTDNGYGSFRLTQFRGQLIAAGSFTNSSDPNLRNIARWNGTAWVPLGTGLDRAVRSVAGDGQSLYTMRLTASRNKFVVSRWDGVAWTDLAESNALGENYGELFVGPHDDLYVGGYFFSGINGVVSPNLIRWNGREWESLLDGTYEGVAGLINTVSTFARHQKDVFAGGIFYSAGDAFTPGVARWDGHRWHKLGTALAENRPTRVRSLASSGPLLFAGGVFTNIGGVNAANIAAWDGTHWNPVGGGAASNVNALAWWNGSLYAGGAFQQAGDIEASRVARWTGLAWHPLGSGCNSNVSALAVWNKRLVAGGNFTSAGNVTAAGIAAWDGTNWMELGGGITGPDRPTVTRLAAGKDGLYVAGRFQAAGGTAVTNLARWDGTNWRSVGGGWHGVVDSLAVRNGDVFVGGRLLDETGLSYKASGVFRWDRKRWSSLGKNLSDPRSPSYVLVSAILPMENSLFIGGRFPYAGNKVSAGVARWIPD